MLACVTTTNRWATNQLAGIRKHWQFYLIILLPLMYLLIFKYVPMYGLIIAFKRYRVSLGILRSPWVGWVHFQRFFTSPTSIDIISNTILLSVYSILASFPMAIILAISLNETKNKNIRKFVQMVTYAPYFISTVVLVAMLFQLFDPHTGIVNRLVELVFRESRNFMGDPVMFRHVYVWSTVWQSTGYNAIIYLAALTAISPELYEAAIVDGANKFQRIRYIDLPSIIPTVIVLLILNMGYIMNVGFEKVYLMQNALNLERSEILSTYVYRVGLLNTDYSFSTAVGLFNSIINLVLLLSVNSLAKRFGESSLW
jgi:putative aldouronate transport system permease protein